VRFPAFNPLILKLKSRLSIKHVTGFSELSRERLIDLKRISFSCFDTLKEALRGELRRRCWLTILPSKFMLADGLFIFAVIGPSRSLNDIANDPLIRLPVKVEREIDVIGS